MSWLWQPLTPAAPLIPAVPPLPGVGPAGAASFVLALEAGTKVSLQWETDILKPWSGKESRVTNLGAPRQTYDAPAYLVDGEDRDTRSKLVQSAAAGLPFLLGLSYEEMTLSADSSGTTVFVNSTAYCDWLQPGQRVLVVGPDGTVASGVVQNAPGYPASSAAMTTALGYGSSWNGYLHDEASGNAVPAFGANTLIVNGTPVYGAPGVLSGADKAVQNDTGSSFTGATNAIYDVAVGDDLAIVRVIKLSALVDPNAFVRLTSKSTFGGGGGAHHLYFAGASTGQAQVGIGFDVFGSISAFSTVGIPIASIPADEWGVLCAVLERATNKIRVGWRSLVTGNTVVSALVSFAVESCTNTGLFALDGFVQQGCTSQASFSAVTTGPGVATGLAANLSTALANFAASLFPTSIVLDAAPGAAGKKGGKIMPAQAIYLDAQQGFSRAPVHVEHWQLKARAALFGYGNVDAMGVGQGLRVFDGRYVFNRGLFVEGNYGDGMHSLVELIDLGGIVSSSGAAPVPDWGREVRLFSNVQADWQWFKCFVQAVRGRALAFLLPTWRPDFAFISKTSSTTFKIASGSVSGAGDITKWFSVSAAHKYLQITQTDGSIVYGKISTVGDNGDGTTTIVLTVGVLNSTPAVISWLELVRFEADTFDVSWNGAMFAVTTQARVVQQ